MDETISNKQKNSKLSIILISVNLILVFILSKTGRATEESTDIITMAYLIGAVVILLGGFAFTYHGKGYQWAKWLFALSVVVGLIFLGLILYGYALAQGFKN